MSALGHKRSLIDVTQYVRFTPPLKRTSAINKTYNMYLFLDIITKWEYFESLLFWQMRRRKRRLLGICRIVL